MLSPARSAQRSEPDDPPPVPRRGRGHGSLLVLVCGLVAALAAVAFPFAPVHQPEVTYRWTASDGAAAIPLMPYQPVELTATTTCAAVRSAGGQVLLSTVPLTPDPAADPLHGLELTAAQPAGQALRVTSAGVELGEVVLPVGDCALVVVSDPTRTAVLVDGVPTLTRDGDVRPDVAGAFSGPSIGAAGGVELELTADTRFQTSISLVKAALAAVAVLGLLGMLVGLARADRAAARRVRLLPRRWWRPHPADLAVTGVLGAWWLVGAITVDDGYIAGIVRGRADNGFIGNVYRWLNAPEAPFSWFYDLFHLWSLASPSTPWMRLPSVLLGLLCWVLVSRLALPRLGRFATRRSVDARASRRPFGVPWVAALALLTWWVPLNVGLRPEPWVAVGALVVFLAVERSVATRGLVPLAVALVVAGATTAVTPAGVLAFAPLVAGGVAVVRVLRSRRDLHRWPLLVALVAAPASAVLLMVYDQSLAGMLEATRVRSVIGGGQPWYEEFQRYATLLESGSFQGSVGRRAAVLGTLLAAAGVLWALRRVAGRSGVAGGPARRLVLGFLLMLAVLTLSPTKWTQHFGDLAGYGATLLVVGAALWSAAVLRPRPRAQLAGLAAATAVCALVLAGTNSWPYAGDWFTPSFSTIPPQVAGVQLATIAAVAGGAWVGWLAARAAWRQAGATGTASVEPVRGPGPVPLVAAVLVAALGLQVVGFGRIAVAHRDSYTTASDALATATGQPCGLQRLLSVETDPAAGLLPTEDGGPPAPRVLPVDVGGAAMPGAAVAGRMATAWFTLDTEQVAGRLPVVVTTSGSTRPGERLWLEFGAGGPAGATVDRRRLAPDTAVAADHRQLAPPDARTVRLVIEAPTAGPHTPAVVSLPRVPRLTPMTELLPAGSTAILDWPVAFLFPCLHPAALPDGTAELAGWRVGPPAADPAAEITYRAGFGGPFTAPRMLVTEQRMATYLAGDPLRDAAQLYRWVPIVALAQPAPMVVDRTVPGWERAGHARVPGLDPIG